MINRSVRERKSRCAPSHSQFWIAQISRRTTNLIAADLRRRQSYVSGFSLVEIMLALTILSIAAFVAFPSKAPTRPYKLDLAASQFADAIRHARTEALRMANPYGVYVESGQSRLRVFRGDVGTLPPTPIFDVVHPVSKRLYEIDLKTETGTQGVAVSTTATWSGACALPQILGFDAAGIPRCGSSWNVLLETSQIALSHAGHIRLIIVDGETGRVTIQ